MSVYVFCLCLHKPKKRPQQKKNQCKEHSMVLHIDNMLRVQNDLFIIFVCFSNLVFVDFVLFVSILNRHGNHLFHSCQMATYSSSSSSKYNNCTHTSAIYLAYRNKNKISKWLIDQKKKSQQLGLTK